MVSFEVDQIAEREKWENKGGYQSIYNRIIKRILGIARFCESVQKSKYRRLVFGCRLHRRRKDCKMQRNSKKLWRYSAC